MVVVLWVVVELTAETEMIGILRECAGDGELERDGDRDRLVSPSLRSSPSLTLPPVLPERAGFFRRFGDLSSFFRKLISVIYNIQKHQSLEKR